ncbi:MAG: GntR family transcriptional regulator [Spirochaetes bacterium]|nr:GntR family transcriptional regulator [Spirochaetota bacterium]
MMIIKLDNRQIPLHYQIADYLLMMLDKGELSYDSQLPPEEELKDLFGVSRTTIRRAMEHLLDKRLVYRKQGKGTFWTESAKAIKNEKLAGLNRQIFGISNETRVTVLSKRKEKSSNEVATILKIPPESTVIVFERLRTLRNKPMSFTINYLPFSIGMKIKKSDLEKRTMLETLEEVIGIELGTIEHEVEITRANSQISHLLQIPVLNPVLTIKTSVFDAIGNPIEVVWTHFVENMYKFKVVLGN